MNHRIVSLSPGLYFVSTPIGTARDITLRALDVLASADMLVAEDTRSLRKLLDIHGIPLNDRRILSYHDHSGARARTQVLEALNAQQSVAYASEAGTPLIADPGYALSREAAAAGHLVTAAPGPSAVVMAMTLAGLPTDTFAFCGFLPNASRARKARLAELAGFPGTLVFYESPKRVAASLADMADVLGPTREAALCRELTKKFEQIRRGSLQVLAQSATDAPPKGEIVLVVDRPTPQDDPGEETLNAAILQSLLTHSVKDTADMVSQAFGIPRRKVYQMTLELEKNRT